MFRALTRLLRRGALDPAQLALPLSPSREPPAPPFADRGPVPESLRAPRTAVLTSPRLSPSPATTQTTLRPDLHPMVGPSGVTSGGLPVGITPKIPRRRRTAAEHDAAAAVRLLTRHAELNAERFGGALRTIGIELSRRLRSRLGYYRVATSHSPGLIAISCRHLRRHGWDEAVETLLHEMVHQWQDESGLPVDHGSQFRAKARAVGCVPRARRQVG